MKEDDLEKWSRALNTLLASIGSNRPMAISPTAFQLLQLDLTEAANLADAIAKELTKRRPK